jgi:hypothetical protein
MLNLRVKHLKKILRQDSLFDGSTPVMLSTDEEGNAFGSLSGWSVDLYSPSREEMYDPKDGDAPSDAVLVLTLWP